MHVMFQNSLSEPFILISMAIHNFNFQGEQLPPSFHSKHRSRKTSTTPTESKKPRREGDEDSEISESDEVDTGAKCIALIPTRS